MKKFLNIKVLMQGVMFMSMFSAMLITFMMAYIMFAPDDWPKPFYLAYAGASTDTDTTDDDGHNAAATAEPSQSTTGSLTSGGSAAYRAAMAAGGVA